MRSLSRTSFGFPEAAAVALLLTGVFLAIPRAAPRVAGPRWTTRGFADFSQGQLGASGANLYVSHRGATEMINLFDFNRDGYLDLLFNQTHDYNSKVDSVVYWNGPAGFDPARKSTVAAEGGYRGLAFDLNGDGYPDLVLANRFNGTTYRVNSYVYWGSASGFSPSRRTALPTLGATGVAAGDLNRDGYPDLVFSNGGSLEAFTIGKVDDRVSYIYWGGPKGFSLSARSDLPAVNPTAVAVADLNGDGYPEIIVANSGPDSPGVYVYWNGPAGISAERRDTLGPKDAAALLIADLDRNGSPDLVVVQMKAGATIFWNKGGALSAANRTDLAADGAVAVCAGDLNADGYPDLVLAGEAGATIYWGSGHGYAAARRSVLASPGVSACAIGDLDGDGRDDLVLARYQDDQSYDVGSEIFWGGGDSPSAERKTALPTRGATDVRIADFNGDRRPDLFFANNIGGRTKGDISSYIYWGNPAHRYGPQSRTELHTHSAYKACSADLNDDGYVDLIIANSWDDEPTGAGTAFLYWGGPDGFQDDHRQDLTVGGVYGCSVADLNRDGFLDIIFSNVFTKEETAHHPRRDFGDDGGVIYWGSPAGYSYGNRTLLPARAPMGNRIADFNKDGYLDILFTTWQGGDAVIFWGGKAGFSAERATRLPAISSVNAEIADLDHDGYLDIILCNHINEKTLKHNVSSYIYYGSPDGFSSVRRTELPTLGAHDASVADLNGDGYLDIAFSNYHADYTRSPASYIYWGDSAGRYSPQRRTELPTDSAAGNFIADLNGDGYPDIVFSNHLVDGGHHTNSFIYWGGPSGFDVSRRSLVPTIGPHNMFSVDIGNIYTRKLEEEYISSPYRIAPGLSPERLEWLAETPFGTGVKFQIRTAESAEALAGAPWTGPRGSGTFWTRSGEPAAAVPPNPAWMQYKAVLTTPDGGNTPRLTEVTVVFQKRR